MFSLRKTRKLYQGDFLERVVNMVHARSSSGVWNRDTTLPTGGSCGTILVPGSAVVSTV